MLSSKFWEKLPAESPEARLFQAERAGVCLEFLDSLEECLKDEAWREAKSARAGAAIALAGSVEKFRAFLLEIQSEGFYAREDMKDGSE